MANALTLDALRALDAIDRKGSFAAAAEALYKVPSALSYTIQKLEQDLSVQIFDRSRQRAQLTQAGQLLLQQGRHLLQASQQLEDAVKQLDTGWETRLRIAVDTVVPISALFSTIADFSALGRMTQLSLREEVMAGSWEALQTGRADLVVGLSGEGVSGQFQLLPMAPMEFVFAVAPEHPLAQLNRPIDSADVQGYLAVVVADSAHDIPGRDSGLFDSRQRLQVHNMAGKIAAHQAGLGIGFLPAHLIRTQLQQGTLVAKACSIPRPPVTLYLGWRKNAEGQALQWFSQQLSQLNWASLLSSLPVVLT